MATKDLPTKDTLPDIASRSLRLRLLFWIILALAPAALVSLLQGVDRVRRDENEVRERLIQTARATATDEENMLASAEQIARALANQVEVRNAAPECGTALASALKGLTYFVNIARVGSDGTIRCAAMMPPPPQTVVAQPWWRDAQRQAGFFITPQRISTTVNRPILAAVLPLRAPGGDFDGAIAIGMDIQWFDFMLHIKQVPPGAVAAVFDPAGALIAANNLDVARVLFGTHPPAPGNVGTLASATGPNDAGWSYAAVPLSGSNMLLALAMRDSDLFSGTYLHVATDLLLPFLMLGLASFAIWIATDRQVTRWIIYLRRIATAYARGHYAIRPVALEEAPNEFRMLGETFTGMAAAVQDRDRRLREALSQKTLLIKETHHRVKNNLQIVVSLLSLQAQKLTDPVAQEALRQAQLRVNALALVHRILHEIEEQGEVDLKMLMHDLVHQIEEGFGAERRDLKLELDMTSCLVPADLAVPLTLFAVEALTNSFKHAYPEGRGGTIRLSLAPAGEERLRLAIEDDGVGPTVNVQPRGIGSRLIQAFAHQVGGTVTTGLREGGGTSVSLVFRDPNRRIPEI